MMKRILCLLLMLSVFGLITSCNGKPLTDIGLNMKDDSNGTQEGDGEIDQTISGPDIGAEADGAINDIILISMGASHSAAVNSRGDLYMWGDNENGQLGSGTVDTALSPQIVPGLNDIKYVDLGSGNSAAINQSGDL